MRKKMLSIALAGTMVAAMFAGCGSSGTASSASSASAASSVSESASEASSEEASSASAESTSESSTETAGLELDDSELLENIAEYTGDGTLEGKKIGFSTLSLGSDFLAALADQIQAAVEAAGASMQVDSADGDANTQVEQIENYVTMGMDMIIVFAVSPEALVSVIGNAKDDGVPVMAFAYEIPTDDVRISMISADEEIYGSMAAQLASDWIDETFPDAEDGSVDVLVIGATDTQEDSVRSANLERISENSKVNMTRYDVTDPNVSDEGRKTAENQFLLKSDYDAVLCCNAATALGVNAYLMSSDSPIAAEDRANFGIFLVDETTEIVSNINDSIDNNSLIRGTVSMGALSRTVEIVMACITNVLTDGTPVTRVNGSGENITAANVADFLDNE